MIYCEAVSNNGCNVFDSVKIIYDICSNISSIEGKDNSLTLIPNPIEDNLTIRFSYSEDGKVNIYDELGKLQYQEKFINNKKIDLSFLRAGIYFLNLESKNKVYIEKIIKIN